MKKKLKIIVAGLVLGLAIAGGYIGYVAFSPEKPSVEEVNMDKALTVRP